MVENWGWITTIKNKIRRKTSKRAESKFLDFLEHIIPRFALFPPFLQNTAWLNSARFHQLSFGVAKKTETYNSGVTEPKRDETLFCVSGLLVFLIKCQNLLIGLFTLSTLLLLFIICVAHISNLKTIHYFDWIFVLNLISHLMRIVPRVKYSSKLQFYVIEVIIAKVHHEEWKCFNLRQWMKKTELKKLRYMLVWLWWKLTFVNEFFHSSWVS